MSTRATGSSTSSRSPLIRPACRTSRTSRLPPWASMSSSTKFLMEELRRDAGDEGLQPRFRQGHHPLYRQARQGRGPPLHHAPACARVSRARPIGAMWARWMPTGRPMSTSPISRPSSTFTIATGRSGPTPRSSRRPNSSMTRRAAWLGRVFAGRRATASFPAAALRPQPALHRGARAIPIPTLDEAVVLPDCHIGRGASLSQRRHRPGRHHSGRSGRRRGPGSRRQALPPHRQGRLPDHPGR